MDEYIISFVIYLFMLNYTILLIYFVNYFR
jgi:hypothetical protein